MLWTQNSEIPFSLVPGKCITSVSFPGFWILQFECYLHVYFKWNYRFLAANGKATQRRVWWYKALRTVDTTGGWQMRSPATHVGTGKGELCRADERQRQLKGEDTFEVMKLCPSLCGTLYGNPVYSTEIHLVVCELGLAGGGARTLQHFGKLQWWVRGLSHEKLLF